MSEAGGKWVMFAGGLRNLERHQLRRALSRGTGPPDLVAVAVLLKLPEYCTLW